MEILIGVEVARSCSLRGKAVMGRVMEREKEKALNLVARNSRTTTKWTRALSLMSFVRLSPCGNGQSRWQELKPCLAAPGRPVLYLYRLPSACHYLKIETETPRDRERKRGREENMGDLRCLDHAFIKYNASVKHRGQSHRSMQITTWMLDLHVSGWLDHDFGGDYSFWLLRVIHFDYLIIYFT